jgi:hyperosmotically inducible periplasmic protein
MPTGTRQLVHSLAVFGLCSTFAACGPADRWDERPPGEGTRAEMPGAGEETNDRWITTQIQAQYFADTDVRGRDLTVETDDGVVTLRGEVPDEQIRQHVLTIARNTAGVERVEDRLSVAGQADPTTGAPEQTPEAETRTPARGDRTLPATEGEPTERDMTERLSAAWVTTQIQARYFADPDVRGADIEVTTANGVATLRGRVENEQMRERALQIARDVDGVRRVDDQLTVGQREADVEPAEPARRDEPRRPEAEQERREEAVQEKQGDEEITTRIQAKFFEDEQVRHRNIEVSTTGGVVTLRGEVATEDERERARTIAREVEGVQDVRDELDVRPETPPTTGAEGEMRAKEPEPPARRGEEPGIMEQVGDGWITTQIRARYFTERQLRAGEIDVTTADGVVTLTGHVPTETARQQAVELAREINGVHRVEDRLEVRPRQDERQPYQEQR